MSKYKAGKVEIHTTLQSFGTKIVELMKEGYNRITSFGTKLAVGQVYKATVKEYRTIPLVDNITGEKKLLTLYAMEVEGLPKESLETMIAGESKETIRAIGDKFDIEVEVRDGKKFVQFALPKVAKPELLTAAEPETATEAKEVIW